jgi:hypothetical protein
LKNLEEGTIDISLLRMINNNGEIFTELLSLFSENLSVKIWTESEQKGIKSKIKKVLQYRILELENFLKFYKLISEFYNTFLKNSELGKFYLAKNFLKTL